MKKAGSVANWTELWRSTPPAVFPLCLGVLGMGLAWRRAALVFSVPSVIGAVVLILGTVMTLFFAISYARKFLARPGILMEDLSVVTARGALPALPMALMLIAAGLAPFGTLAAQLFWFPGLILQFVMLAAVLLAYFRSNLERRATNPLLFLPFCGFLVAPLAGSRLGYDALTSAIFTACLPVYFVILAGSIKNAMMEPIAHSQRAAQVVHLAPISLFGLIAAMLGHSAEFTVCVFLSGMLALILLMWSGWISEAGWRPVWGALTFPVAAFTNLQLVAANRDFGVVSDVMALGGLVVGSALTGLVAVRMLQSWIRGELAEQSMAASV